MIHHCGLTQANLILARGYICLYVMFRKPILSAIFATSKCTVSHARRDKVGWLKFESFLLQESCLESGSDLPVFKLLDNFKLAIQTGI